MAKASHQKLKEQLTMFGKTQELSSILLAIFYFFHSEKHSIIPSFIKNNRASGSFSRSAEVNMYTTKPLKKKR